MFFSFKLCMCQDPRVARAYTAQNTKICALLACLAQPTYPIPARCGTNTAGRGAFEPPPEDVFHSIKPGRRQAKQTNAQALQTPSKTNARVCHRKFKTSATTVWKWCQFRKSSRRCRRWDTTKMSEFLLDMRYFCNFSLVSLGIRPRSRRCAERTRQGEGRWSRPPKPALERSYLTEISSSANRILRPRRKKSPDQIPETKEWLYIYIQGLRMGAGIRRRPCFG